jgi:ABC-2 type transport system permease protein
MNKTGIIIKREYLRRVRKKSFVILTLLMPILMAVMTFVPLWISQISRIKSDGIRTVVVMDATGKYRELFRDTENYKFVGNDKSIDEYRNSRDKSVFALLNIRGDLLADPDAATLYSEKQIPEELTNMVSRTLTRYLENEKLESFNIPNLRKIIAESKVSLHLQTVKWEEDGRETSSSTLAARVTGIAFTVLIYMFILIYGGMVMGGVQEEKTNRIVELIISSVKPFELMTGKIIAIGLVGLTQFFFWGLLLTVLVGGAQFFMGIGMDASVMQQTGGIMQPGMNVTPQNMDGAEKIFRMLSSVNLLDTFICFVLYFAGGYLLYASLFSAIGSAINQPEDAQQFMMPISILLILALYIGIYGSENPDGLVAFWSSLFPLTSPVVMMMRLPFDVPLWEKVVSLTLLFATAIGTVWLSAKIYRVGILMYGKKPNIREMIKWIRYK